MPTGDGGWETIGKKQLAQLLWEAIDLIEGLGDDRKAFLRSRWLDQVIYFENGAAHNFKISSFAIVVTLVGAALIPVLTLSARTCVQTLPLWGWNCDVLDYSVVILGLAVTLAAGLRQAFSWDEQWRHYRRLSEALKSEGWDFIQLSGEYQGMDRDAAYIKFAGRIEASERTYVDAYVTRVVPPKPEEANENNGR
jgi:Protein of unknown function (DUF4231)